MSAASISSPGGGNTAWRQAATTHAARPGDAAGGLATAKDGGDAQGARAGIADALSEAEQRQVAELEKRDREVRAHEMAHVAAGAGLVTRGASYTYQTGPDGQRYAIGGEVGIDSSPGRTPEESLAKAERIRAAALAPAEPSGQDRQVAAQAARMASDARMEIARREFEQGGADPAATATRDGLRDRGLRAEEAYSAALVPAQAPTLSATA